METVLTSPAASFIMGIPARAIFILVPLLGVGAFGNIMRTTPGTTSEGPRGMIDSTGFHERITAVLKMWLAQWRQPRYMFAGVLHIIIFAGFIILSARSVRMVILGFKEESSSHGV